ncbi:MAG TPA: tripartite tricarboxylate transporter substrate binding protein [Burkholderiales bacterium]|nr:tripartite tricarboxylate transporter substrate binding protein [Burkholderiales bacterium]
MQSRFPARWAGVGLALSFAFAANAQQDAAKDFPNKPVRIIVGFAAGGGNDIIVRVLAPRLTEALGQSVIIDNRPGAAGMIAAELGAKATPDGYTLFMGPIGTMAMNPAIYSKLPYSPLQDFAQITMIGSFPLLLVVHPSLGAKSVKELVAFSKTSPEKSNYASSAAPFQLSSELFNQKTGARFTHIPYKSSGESVSAVIGGQVTFTIADPPPVVGQLKAGRVRALAVTSAARHPSWPDLPTMAEAGIPGIEVTLWTGFHAPARTPTAVVKRLHAVMARVIHLPDSVERLAGMAIDPVGNTPEEFRRIIAADIAKWTAVAKAANIKAD